MNKSGTHEDDMYRLCALIISILLTMRASLCSAAEVPENEAKAAINSGWVPLFDGKTLNGWYTNLRGKGRNEDPTKVFQASDGVIHVYKDHADGGDVSFGCLTTEKEFAYFHLRMEFKWGDKRFGPRAQVRRDAGVLYHVMPPYDVWPRSVECQIQEGDVGDCFVVRGTQVATHVEIATIDTPSGPKKLPRYKPLAEGGEPQTIGEGPIARIVKSNTPERDGWNTVEVIVHGNEKTTHIVNGHTVFEATNLRQLSADKKTWEPLDHGQIVLQAEYAEVLYRNIEIRPIPNTPFIRDPR
jgi:hypothetical protein